MDFERLSKDVWKIFPRDLISFTISVLASIIDVVISDLAFRTWVSKFFNSPNNIFNLLLFGEYSELSELLSFFSLLNISWAWIIPL